MPVDLGSSRFAGLELTGRPPSLCRSVCHGWRSLHGESRSWLSVGIPPGLASRFESFYLTYLCHSWHDATSLSFRACPLLCDPALALVWAHTPEATSIDLSECEMVTDATLKNLARAACCVDGKLKTLKLNRNEHVSHGVRRTREATSSCRPQCPPGA